MNTGFLLQSEGFENGADIPVKYARYVMPGGQNISAPFSWSNAPAGTKSFALAVIDRSANDWVHWMVVNIPAGVNSLPEGVSGTAQMPEGAQELVNTFRQPGYGGPQPPRGTGVHQYETTVYALSTEKVDLSGEATVDELEEAVRPNLLGSAKMVGRMGR